MTETLIIDKTLNDESLTHMNILNNEDLTNTNILDDNLTNSNILNETSTILPEYVTAILLVNYNYSIIKIRKLSNYITGEEFFVNQFEVDLIANVNSVESTQKWLVDFEETSKTTMPQTKGNPVLKNPNSLYIRNIECKATLHLRLEQWNLQMNYPLEINIKYIHNHVVHSAKALSFRHVRDEVHDKYLELFKNGHLLATARFTYEDSLHLQANNNQELMQWLADHAQNPNHNYVSNLFKEFHKNYKVDSYNNSGKGHTILQEYDSQSKKAFILCIVTNLMVHVHERINQSGEICYVDASAFFELLNTSVTLFYTSCIARALPFGLIIMLDELKITLKKGIIMLKSLFPSHAFF
ncbi:45644_t:CDS:2, partial [Gigaspora margarita]